MLRRLASVARVTALALAPIAVSGLLAPAIALAAGPPGQQAPASSHVIDETRITLIVTWVGFALVALLVSDMLIGHDKRVSTSKTTAAVWTYLVAGALLAYVIAKFIGDPQGLESIDHSGLAGQYGLLIGGPIGAAIAAKGIVNKQVKEEPNAKPPAEAGEKANPAQLVQGDDGSTDLGDFQYVLFNLVAMVFFVGALVQSPTNGFPHIPDVLLGVTSVSALGYAGKKGLALKPAKPAPAGE